MCRSPRQEDLSDSKNLAFLRVPSPAWPLRSRNSVQWPPATTYFQAFEVYERPGLTDLLQLTHQRGQPMAATASQAQLPLLPTTEGNDLPQVIEANRVVIATGHLRARTAMLRPRCMSRGRISKPFAKGLENFKILAEHIAFVRK